MSVRRKVSRICIRFLEQFLNFIPPKIFSMIGFCLFSIAEIDCICLNHEQRFNNINNELRVFYFLSAKVNNATNELAIYQDYY